MKPITSSNAKNHFGAVLARLKDEPVAVERYGKTIAFLVPANRRLLNEHEVARREARLLQAGVEKDRLNKHLRIGLALLSGPSAAVKSMLAGAQAEVARWERDGLCSTDYIDRWQRLLSLPAPELAQQMCGDAGGWGPALRQNSPWR